MGYVSKYRGIDIDQAIEFAKENADIVIKVYSDYVCPLCYIQNIMLHKAVQEYKNIRVVKFSTVKPNWDKVIFLNSFFI